MIPPSQLPAGSLSPLPESSHPDEQRAVALLVILTVAAVGMAALLALFPAAGHDQLWFLLMARRWLAGATLYGPEAFDSNPPAIVWLSAVPVSLGHLLHAPATLLGKLFVGLLLAACALFSFKLLPKAWRQPRPYEAYALLFAAIILFAVVPARDFGQRDHMVSFLLLPYVLSTSVFPPARLSRLPGIAAGLLAGLALCLKPHYALVPLFVESSTLLWPRTLLRTPEPSSQANGLRRRLRPEPVVLVLVATLYFLAIRRFAPLYFTQAIPLTRQVYSAIGRLTVPHLLWEAIELCILAALALWLFSQGRRASSPAVRFLLIAGAGAFAAYMVQGTGWYYQQLPAISFFGLALALQFLDVSAARPLRLPAWLPRAVAALSVLALALTTHFTGYPFTPDRAFAIDSPDPALFRDLPPGTPVAILTTSVDEAMMPTERFHLTWAQRTNNLWLLPQVLRAERPEGQPAHHTLSPTQLQQLDLTEHRWMVEDLTRWAPQLVLIEHCQNDAVHCQVLEDRHDDLLAWFNHDPAFACLWQQHYVFSRTDARFDVYTRH